MTLPAHSEPAPAGRGTATHERARPITAREAAWQSAMRDNSAGRIDWCQACAEVIAAVLLVFMAGSCLLAALAWRGE
jgi:hypothetical protein